MPSAKQPPRRSVLIAARLITAVVSVAGAEGVLWFGGYPDWWALDENWGSISAETQQDPELGWTSRPGTYQIMWSGIRDTPQRQTNWSNGRRATSARESNGSARPQAMFFGCSFIQGYGLSDSETLPWIVQERHPELAVSNFGVGNYGTYQAYLAMKRSVHGPVSAFYQLNGFHEDRNAAARSWLRVNKRPPPGFFFPYAVIRDGRMEDRRSRGNLVWPVSQRLRSAALVEDWTEIIEAYPRVRKQRELTEMLLAEMDRLVKAQGGVFTVIMFDLEQTQRQEYREFLSSHGIAFVDCNRPELGDRGLRLPDGHPSEKLNRLQADWIEPGLAASSLTAATRWF